MGSFGGAQPGRVAPKIGGVVPWFPGVDLWLVGFEVDCGGWCRRC
jgi:hypothetical protein